MRSPSPEVFKLRLDELLTGRGREEAGTGRRWLPSIPLIRIFGGAFQMRVPGVPPRPTDSEPTAFVPESVCFKKLLGIPRRHTGWPGTHRMTLPRVALETMTRSPPGGAQLGPGHLHVGPKHLLPTPAGPGGAGLRWVMRTESGTSPPLATPWEGGVRSSEGSGLSFPAPACARSGRGRAESQE